MMVGLSCDIEKVEALVLKFGLQNRGRLSTERN